MNEKDLRSLVALLVEEFLVVWVHGLQLKHDGGVELGVLLRKELDGLNDLAVRLVNEEVS